MIPTFENGGLWVLLALVGLALALFFFAKWRNKVRYQRNKRQQDLANRKHQQLLDRQENLGNRIYNALVTACSQNPSGKMRVERIKDNRDLGYSIFAGFENRESYTMGGVSYRGHPVLRVSINLEKQTYYQVSVAWGPYPNPHDKTAYEMHVDGFESGPELQIMCDRMITYSPYKTA